MNWKLTTGLQVCPVTREGVFVLTIKASKQCVRGGNLPAMHTPIKDYSAMGCCKNLTLTRDYHNLATLNRDYEVI